MAASGTAPGEQIAERGVGQLKVSTLARPAAQDSLAASGRFRQPPVPERRLADSALTFQQEGALNRIRSRQGTPPPA